MLLSKSQERRIAEVIRLVHERRLAESLAPVEEAILSWREGARSIFEIDKAIHQHSMRAKRYFAVYANTAASSPEAVGVLEEALDLSIINKEEHKHLTGIKT